MTRSNYKTSQGFGFQQYAPGSIGPFQNKTYKKHSGCRVRSSWVSRKTGEVVNDKLITGWNYSRSRGMITFIAAPKKYNSESKIGRECRGAAKGKWENWTLKMSYSDGRKPVFFNALYQISKERLFLPDLQMMANPSKNYFGTYIRKKN